MENVRRRSKLTIVGAGSVGATTAYACQIRGVAQTIAIYDLDGDKARAEVLDLNHGVQFTPMTEIIGGNDIEVCRDSDVIVVTAGAKQKPGQTRLDLAGVNVAMTLDLVPRLLAVSPDAIVLMVSNPCDVLTYAALKASGLPRNRVFGSGTVLDSARLRFLLAQHAGVALGNVHAYIVGEHGDSEIAVWSSANISTIPVREWSRHGGNPLTEEDLDQVHHETVHAAYEIIQGKGATWYAIGLSCTRILEAVFNDEDRVLPVSSLLTDYKGVSDVCLSVPTIVNRAGAGTPLDIPMNDDEVGDLRSSADAVRGVGRSLGL
jgi:L-lactate dehydrogenase